MEGAVGVRKGTWTEEEDALLKEWVEKYGEGNWHQVPRRAGLNRCRKSCRLRWLNYLKPNIKRGAFQEDEVDMIIRLHKLLGNRWSLIAGRLLGRTANDVKNYWNTHLVKKVIHHKPKEDDPQRKFATKMNVIRPRPWNLSKSSAWLKGKATLVASMTPTGENLGQQSPMLSRRNKESAWWENLFTDNDPDKVLIASRSGSEGQRDAKLWPQNLAMEEGQNGWNELSVDADNDPDKVIITSRSSSEGQQDAQPWPQELAMEEGQNGWNELSFNKDIWELFGAGPQADI